MLMFEFTMIERTPAATVPARTTRPSITELLRQSFWPRLAAGWLDKAVAYKHHESQK